MDPKATLLAALEAIKQGDHDEARELLNAYWAWIRSGGYVPEIEGGDFANALELLLTKEI
jgi:hypothetical protein